MLDNQPLKSPQSKFRAKFQFFLLKLLYVSILNSARDANQFTVSVNIEPQAKMLFNLTYEELLTRRRGIYEQVIFSVISFGVLIL